MRSSQNTYNDPLKFFTAHSGLNKDIRNERQQRSQTLDSQAQGALVKDIIRGKTNASEAARVFDLKLSEIQQWSDVAEAGMGNALRANPRDIAEMYGKKID